jgi:hypothetical protein
MPPFALWMTAGLLATWTTVVAAQPALLLTPFSTATSREPPLPWRVVALPTGHKPLTRFDITPLDGRPVLRVQTDRSYANLVHDLPEVVPASGTLLRWRWRLDQPLRETDLRHREGDDSALKVCLLFDMSLDNLGFMDRSMLRVVSSVSGEQLPAATLCYVWDNNLPVGTLINNAFTSRIRMLVVDSGGAHLGQWISHQRNVIADFHRAFGPESPGLSPLKAVLVGADADNTGGQSLGYVDDIILSR